MPPARRPTSPTGRPGGIYASRWIQHLERTPEAVSRVLEEWMRYYERERITGISWCVVTMRRATGPRTWFELDELPAGHPIPGR